MGATVTWLGGRGDKRRHPRLGEGLQEDTSLFRQKRRGVSKG